MILFEREKQTVFCLKNTTYCKQIIFLYKNQNCPENL